MKRRVASTILAFILLSGPFLGECAFKLPAPEKIVLKNGITLYYLKNADYPLISFQMLVRGAGFVFEPGVVEGIAGLTAELMQKGTAKMDADALAEAVDFMGASLEISAGVENATVSAGSLSEHFPKLMEIAADCLINPSFKEDEFAKERSKRIDNIKAVKDNPGSAVRPYFFKAYFGAHPMGHLASGTESSLKKMTVADVKDFYKQYYRPERAIAGVVGNIDKTNLLEILEATLGKWNDPGPVAPLSTVPALPKPKGRKLILVDKPDASQAYWILGAPGYPIGDKITPQAAVMNTLFGDRFTSWLNTELRIKRGLTYGVASNFQTWSVGGLFLVNSYTKNDSIGEMLDIVLDLLQKARKDGFASEEVESSRNYLQGQFPQRLETNASKARTYAMLAFYNLRFDYYDDYLAKVQAVSPSEAKDAAIKLLPETDFVLVVVGKAAEIKKQLEKYGTWTVKKITDPDF